MIIIKIFIIINLSYGNDCCFRIASYGAIANRILIERSKVYESAIYSTGGFFFYLILTLTRKTTTPIVCVMHCACTRCNCGSTISERIASTCVCSEVLGAGGQLRVYPIPVMTMV